MRKLARAWRFLVNMFSDMSLMKKLTLAYAFAILIPTAAIGSYSYIQSVEYAKKEAAGNGKQRLIQIKGEVERKISISSSIADNIAYNSKIQNLLYYGMDFTAEALNNFMYYTAVPIDYFLNFSGTSIYQMGVYFVNNSIPEYNHFYKEERISEQQWYKEFLKRGQDQVWIYPATSDRYKYNGVSGSRTVIKLIKKINATDGKYLGVITQDITMEEMFSAISGEGLGSTFYIADNKNNIVYPEEYRGDMTYNKLFNKNISSTQGYFFDKDIIYNYDTVNALDLKIISRTPVGDMVEKTTLQSRNMIFAVILGGIILEIFTYFILKLIFSRLKQIVNIMGVVAKGNFSIRIPVLHKDEAGELAQDFNILIEKINMLIEDVTRKETAQKDAQLAALQYQINPHFIYNTIDTFRMRLELDGNYEMADAILYFGKMLRYNIANNSKYATIKEEVDYLEKYVVLQKLRYGDKLGLVVDMPEELANVKIIRFMLQPIVENSLKHGIDGVDKKLVINLSIQQKDAIIQIQITDNGKGINRRYLERLNDQMKNNTYVEDERMKENNIGLKNINMRLKLFYGDNYYLRMDSINGEFTKTTINIPYIND